MRTLKDCLELVSKGKDKELSEEEIKKVEKNFEDTLKLINDTDKFIEDLKKDK